ncbi:hypothetical protein BMS3Abin03_03089 [bacterium BMS3Abin03]|nr:hypothetical protein BMS3Abin03_03089 [bacterium BMS3Abin03]
MYCKECGYQNEPDAKFCNNCGNPMSSGLGSNQYQAPPPSPAVQSTMSSPPPMQNNSGHGKLASLPPQLQGWNWGAFFLTWIWGIGNNTWIAFLTWIPLVNFVMIFVLGAKGNEWAWQNKYWQGIEHFKRVQKLWAIWGFVLFLIGILFAVIIIVVAAAAVNSNYRY